MVRLVVLAALVGGTGCTCSSKSSGSDTSTAPVAETRPPDLAKKGLIVDQPVSGAALTGAWTTVSGWARPDVISMVAIVGAPAGEYYAGTGHMGIPSVPVTLRRDGRFFAPRVPLQDGAVTITILAIDSNGSSYEAINVSVTASNTSEIPAGIQVTPVQPQRGSPAALSGFAGGKSVVMQWDLDGDGTFDAEGASITHSWARAGSFLVVGRAQVDGRWVAASTTLVVSADPEILAQAQVGAAATRVTVLPVYTSSERRPDGGSYPSAILDNGEGRDEILFVALLQPDRIDLYDENLVPKASIAGLSNPEGIATDLENRVYVADTGHDRVARYFPNGELDTSYMDAGYFTGTSAKAMRAPHWVTPGGHAISSETGRYSCEVERCKWIHGPSPDDPRDAMPLFYNDNYDRESVYYRLTNDGHVLCDYGPWRDTGIVAADVALLNPDHMGRLLSADKAGVVHYYQSTTHIASWVLASPVRSLAVSPGKPGLAYILLGNTLELRNLHLEAYQ